MSPETAAFLLNMLNAQQIPANHPNLEGFVGQIVQARGELVAVLESAQAQPESDQRSAAA